VKAREKSLFKDFSKSWNFLLLWPRKQLSYWELNFFFFYTILAILLLHFGATAAPSLSYLEMNIFAIEEVTPLLVLWQGPGCRSVVSICLLKKSVLPETQRSKKIAAQHSWHLLGAHWNEIIWDISPYRGAQKLHNEEVIP
jgi:hypothetical protein